MTADQFRKLALSFPKVEESSHMNHPDFRVGGKIFATLDPEGKWGMVKLTLEQQAEYCEELTEYLEPFPGGWGRMGMTKVYLRPAKKDGVTRVMAQAWRNRAPKRLVAEHPKI